MISIFDVWRSVDYSIEPMPFDKQKKLIRKAFMKKQELTFRFETKVKPTRLLTLLATTRPFTATFVCAK